MGYGRGGVERIPATERMAKGIVFAVARCVVRGVFLWLQVNFCATSQRIGVRSLTRASDFLGDVTGLRA